MTVNYPTSTHTSEGSARNLRTHAVSIAATSRS